MNNQERLDRMRRAMEAEGLDALVLRWPENVLLLSGYWPMIGAAVLVFPLAGKPVLIGPDSYRSEIGQSLWDAETALYPFGVLDAPDPAHAVRAALSDAARGKGWKRIGYEGCFASVAPCWNSAEVMVPAVQTRELYGSIFGGAELTDVTRLLEIERRRKTAYEMDKLRIASEISCIGLAAFEHSVGVGISGVELAAAVEHEIMVKGTGYRDASRVRGYAQVAVGEESAVGYRPNEISTSRRLGRGDIALLELAVVADGFWSDRTRVRVAGEPTDEQWKVFKTVLAAQEAAIQTIREGIGGAEVDKAARSIIRSAGYGASFPHITGHGVGFAYHETAPKLMPGAAEPLAEGMVTSVEPGIYFLPCGGVRIEDDVAVTKTGYEILGPFPKALT